MTDRVTVAVLGAGDRGEKAYGEYILNHNQITAVAVAEPDKIKRKRFAEKHNIIPDYQFESWEQLLAEQKLADGIIIATLDTMHVKPALEAIKQGYKILLEKPIAPSWGETCQVVRQANEYNSNVLVAHVLRYTNFYQKLKELLTNKVIGEIRYVNHIENIGFFHFAHSYVRGNWRNTHVAAPIIVAKSCHDLDLLYWLLEKKCISLSSQASLEHFTSNSQPPRAGDRCLSCEIEDECPYFACKIYLGENTGWPVSAITTDLSKQGRYQALQEGPYGRCVYKCDNNVPEVQQVNMSFEDNIIVDFALTAFSQEINRTTKFFGTKGEIRADFKRSEIKLFKFGEQERIIHVSTASGGHGGGDTGLMDDFVELLQEQTSSISKRSTINNSIESHLLAFAAEVSRKEEKIINIDKWRKN